MRKAITRTLTKKGKKSDLDADGSAKSLETKSSEGNSSEVKQAAPSNTAASPTPPATTAPVSAPVQKAVSSSATLPKSSTGVASPPSSNAPVISATSPSSNATGNPPSSKVPASSSPSTAPGSGKLDKRKKQSESTTLPTSQPVIILADKETALQDPAASESNRRLSLEEFIMEPVPDSSAKLMDEKLIEETKMKSEKPSPCAEFVCCM